MDNSLEEIRHSTMGKKIVGETTKKVAEIQIIQRKEMTEGIVVEKPEEIRSSVELVRLTGLV